jgi:hypothetical protein
MAQRPAKPEKRRQERPVSRQQSGLVGRVRPRLGRQEEAGPGDDAGRARLASRLGIRRGRHATRQQDRRAVGDRQQPAQRLVRGRDAFYVTAGLDTLRDERVGPVAQRATGAGGGPDLMQYEDPRRPQLGGKPRVEPGEQQHRRRAAGHAGTEVVPADEGNQQPGPDRSCRRRGPCRQ